MTSRDRSNSGAKNKLLNGETDKVSPDPIHLVCDEISDKLCIIMNQSLENSNETRRIASMKLDEILKTLVKKNGESARSAAKACNIPLSTFAGYLKPNKKQVDPEHLLKIANHYGVSIDYLFGHQQKVKFDKIPTKRVFSKWVKVTIEDVEEGTFDERAATEGLKK